MQNSAIDPQIDQAVSIGLLSTLVAIGYIERVDTY